MASSVSDMQAMVRVAELGSFARAAEDLRLTPSALSKLVSRVEDRLGVRLINRTTRRLALTVEGALYVQRAREVLDLIEATDIEVSAARVQPKGLLRVNAGAGLGRQLLPPAIAGFLAAYPDIQVDLSLTDRLVDPVAEQIDVVIRGSAGPAEGLVSHKLASARRVMCASPAYLARHGEPKTIADLEGHNCLALTTQSALSTWPLRDGKRVVQFKPRGTLSGDNIALLADMAMLDVGILRLADVVIGPALRDGRLVEIMRDLNAADELGIWALMPRGRFRLPRVKVFVDYLEDWLKLR